MNKVVNYIRTIYYMIFVLLVRLFYNHNKWIYKIGYILGLLRYQTGYVGKTRSKKSYLATISKALDTKKKNISSSILKAFWINHQKGFCELFLSRWFNKDNFSRFLNFEGLDILDKALAEQRGVVLAVPHFGNERLIHIGLALKGYPVSVITSKFENTTGYVRKIKLGSFINLHPVGYPEDSPRWMYNTLKENRILQISPPADEGPKGQKIHFLNHDILVSKTPARLALKTGAALIPAFEFRNSDDTHTIKIKPELDIYPSKDKNLDISKVTIDLMQEFEKKIRKHPEQFYWMWLMIKKDEARKFLKEIRQS